MDKHREKVGILGREEIADALADFEKNLVSANKSLQVSVLSDR